ncbi:hypothetical protein AXX17_AT1G27630 [Arabidopsis thaliana]|uniref:AAA+ ATPase domain-containing protein n=2 Tax=Arabidopsis TaxID=3701 RepID=A0A178WML5_ARATH|nr:hypothetical protein AXX17_AT1G27630 [Arabidopsis thaliana]
MIGLVVKRVLAQVRNSPENVADYTVGLESCVEDLMKLLNFKPTSSVQFLGIYGMGGIGKTTLAKYFYNKIIVNFEHRAIIYDVREQSSTQDGLDDLKRTFKVAREKKNIVVLDDVDNIDQVNALVGETSWYGEGSLVVITTRDEEILNRLSVNLRYEVKCLTEMQALKLFCFYSLRKEKPPTEGLLELSKKSVELTGLLPLALKVFGSHLFDKEENEWQVQLEKLKTFQPDKLQGVLALSFESLDDEEKKVFLDIACLFLRLKITKDEVVDILKGCGFQAEAALSVLRQKSLIKIRDDNNLWMHDHIRDMGRHMVLNESREDPGMRSRLWDHGAIMTVLNNMKGTPSIRGIVCDFKKKSADDIASRSLLNNPAEENPKSSEIIIPVEPFVLMTKLRLLQINNVELEGNLKLLPSELKWIQWKGCPLENLPLDFLAGQLAVLDLSESRIRRVQSLRNDEVDENLKVINFRGCHSLETIPDLSNHNALEKLVLDRCKLLVKVPSSVGKIRTLLQLDLRNCSNLSEFLVDVSGLKRLEKLVLSGCSNLSVLPKNIGAMQCLKKLLLDGTAIKNVPGDIYRLQNLEKLSLRGCRSIQELPSCVGTLTSLEKLYLDNTALQNLPSSIKKLKNLQKLHLRLCRSLSEIPDTINELISLKELVINRSGVKMVHLKSGSLPWLTDFSAGDCKNLKEVSSSIGGLNSLLQLTLDGTPITTLPDNIGDLQFILKVDLRGCKYLTVLPSSIVAMDTLRKLYLGGSNIEELPEDFGNLENLVLLQMNECKMLKRLPSSFGNLKSLHHLYMEETLVMEFPESFGNLSNLRVLKMLKKPLFRICESYPPGTSKETRFVELPNSFANLLKLEELDARSLGLSGKIPDVLEKLSSLMILNLGNNCFHSLPCSLKGLSNLIELSLYDCQELTCLPPLPCQLKQLNLANCFSLESISDLSELTILHDLNLTNCVKLDDVPGLDKLTALKRLYMSACNSTCYPEVKKKLSKVSLKLLRNLSLPGNRIPGWFSQGPVTFSVQLNREIRGVIFAVVVAVNHEIKDNYQMPDVVEIQVQILELDLAIYTTTLHLSGVPGTSNDQLHICRYPASHQMVRALKDGFTIQVIKREKPLKQGVELKMSGIHLIYEGDDDISGDEDFLTDTQQTVSQKLTNFFSS